MSYDSPEFRTRVRDALPGLEPVEWLIYAASAVSEPGRVLLSQAASSLVTRGWLPPLDNLVDIASEHGGIARSDLHASVAELVSLGLLELEDGKITEFAGTFTTRVGTNRPRADLRYLVEGDGEVHLIGPMSILGVARGLGRSGRVVGSCAVGGSAAAITLHCDESGIHSREPDTVAMFLPKWDGAGSLGAAIAGSALFASDDALAAWQEAAGAPDGMPLASFMFPIAATDLGHRLGASLETMLDRLANFA